MRLLFFGWAPALVLTVARTFLFRNSSSIGVRKQALANR